MKLTENNLYSIHNSYIVVKKIEKCLEVINIRGWKGETAIFSVPCDEAEITPDYDKLVFVSDGNTHELALYGKFGVILKGKTPLNVHYHKLSECRGVATGYEALSCIPRGNALFLNDYKNEGYLWVYAIKGDVRMNAIPNESCSGYQSISYDISVGTDGYETKFITSYDMGTLTYTDDGETFESASSRVKADFKEWLKKYPNISQEWTYTMWVNFVGRHGILPTDSQVSGKMGMRALWSWDNLFSAMALAGKFDEKAFDLFMMPYRFLLDNGYMFDSITDSKINYSYTKPPVHGLAYAQMMKDSDFFTRKDVLREVVVPMRKNTEYWLYQRAEEPFYTHGNDSTCDDATCFANTRYASTPDLYALLSVQCETIADIYARLAEKENSEKFTLLSFQLAKKVEDFVMDDSMSIKDVVTGEYYAGNSLLLYRAFIVYDKLSVRAQNVFLRKIKTFETKYGFASEPPSSPFYNGSGYWKGAVWAPDQYFMYYALKKAGQDAYAEEMAKRYIDGIKKAGCYENIDGQKGIGNNCSVFSWTAAVATWLTYATK